MQIHSNQMLQITNLRFYQKLEVAFCRDVPDFADLDSGTRHDFLGKCIGTGKAKGLLTEQGVAAYALGVWWLGENFEERSSSLLALLRGDFPEVRKVYAMNEWIGALISSPDDIATADEALKQGYDRSCAW